MSPNRSVTPALGEVSDGLFLERATLKMANKLQISSVASSMERLSGRKTERSRTLRTGHILLKAGGFAVALVAALLDILREALATSRFQQSEERQLHDSDLSGELNHRTGRLDSGTDPYGWYDRD
jgi:hypothetical protein